MVQSGSVWLTQSFLYQNTFHRALGLLEPAQPAVRPSHAAEAVCIDSGLDPARETGGRKEEMRGETREGARRECGYVVVVVVVRWWGCVVVWACGGVVVWLCGSVVVRLCGCVVVL